MNDALLRENGGEVDDTGAVLGMVVGMIEMTFQLPPFDPSGTGVVEELRRVCRERLSWASAGEVDQLAACWNEYLAVEQRLARVYAQLRTVMPEQQRGSASAQWPTSRDFTLRTGATLNDVFAGAVGVSVEASVDGVRVSDTRDALCA